jgi:hypothetical protein
MLKLTLGGIGLAVGAMMLSCLGAEIFARSSGYRPSQPVEVSAEEKAAREEEGFAKPDPAKGWVNRGGSVRSIEPGHVIMNFLPDGRRSDPLGNKGDDKPKILVVGCSFTQGYGVTDTETYAHLVNAALPEAEVLNFGTGGYGTYQSLLRIRSYFSPHATFPTPLVIYGLIGNHEIRNVAAADWVLAINAIPPHVRIVGGRMIEVPQGSISPWHLESQSALIVMAHRGALNATYSVSTEEQDEVLRRLVETMDETVRGNRSSLLVVGLMDVPSWFTEWAANHKINYVDCVDPGSAQHDPSLQVGGTGAHPSALLHRRWAGCVRKALVGHGFARDDPQIPAPEAVTKQ